MEKTNKNPKRMDLMKLEQLRVNLARKYREPALYNEWFLYPSTDPECKNIEINLIELFKKGKQGIDTVSNFNKYFGVTSERGRGIACLLGLGIADALGASTEFISFEKNREFALIEEGFEEIKNKVKYNMLNQRGEVGVWTDDCSMALCLADSLLQKNLNFDPVDLRLRFLLWIEYGLNNGGRPHSIGLGGNIAQSMFDFVKKPSSYTQELDKFNNGNGSLMRLAPVPIAYHTNIKKAQTVASQQSKTTHNGDQASQCCRLLTQIIVNLINRKNEEQPKQVLLETCNKFESKIKSVVFLSRSEKQSGDYFKEECEKEKFRKFNKSAELDRNWDWKSIDFTYSHTRANLQPEYIGSYCMDALSMALHIVYHKNNFYDAILWATNMGGDSDTVGAIVGQITGAMYGFTHQMMYLYSQMPDVKRKQFRLFKIGYKLSHAGK